ncbi:MAG: hypothetical protein QMD96_05620 [Anaerosomatales bacterium]|nr:hypothetical protein [Anaerosomatales bacterium]
MSAVQVVEALKAAGLPIGKVIVYNAENDPNKLLGRPGQYTEKVSWEDARLEQVDPEDPEGGTVEVFARPEDLAARRSYLEQVTKAAPMFQQYMFEAGNVLMRVSFDLTPDQAKQYEAVLQGLAER